MVKLAAWPGYDVGKSVHLDRETKEGGGFGSPFETWIGQN